MGQAGSSKDNKVRFCRVLITIDSFGERSGDRKVMSVITAGVPTLIRPNGVDLISKEAELAAQSSFLK